MWTPSRAVIVALTLSAVFTAAFISGWKINGWRWQARLQAETQDKLEAMAAYDKISREYVKAYNTKRTETRVVYRTIKERVNETTSGAVCLGADAVRVWNDALTGMPGTPTGTAEKAAPASDTQALDNAAENFEQYEECRSQLNALIDWHERN